jgi:hypothetical protein
MKSISTLFAILSPLALNASIIFTPGNNPSGDVNILLNSGATGTLVTGNPNMFPTVTVDFSSTQSLLEPSSGQARVAANSEGTPLTNLTVSLANGLTYGDLIINPFIGGCANCAGGASTITVRAVSSNGTVEAPVTYTALNIGNGNNFLTITTSGGESIVSTTLSVPGGINDLRQPRISGPFAAEVPEVATYLLIAGGLGLLGVLRVRRA